MPQPTEPTNAQKLTALDGYLQFLLSGFPDGQEDDPLILILVCAQRTLERRIAKTRPTVEWCEIMRWSVLEANRLLDLIYQDDESMANWNPLTPPQTMQQNLAGWLMLVQHELLTDIAEGEAYLKHELETAADEFAREILELGAALEAEQRA